MFFHITPKRNLKNIFENGLVPKIGTRSKRLKEKIPAIYLFKSKTAYIDAVTNWFGDEFSEETVLCVLRIDLPKNIRFLDLGDSSFEISVFENISKENIFLEEEI